jgi:hypothetical protein
MFTPYEIQHQQEIPITTMSAFSMQSENSTFKKSIKLYQRNKAETARLLRNERCNTL